MSSTDTTQEAEVAPAKDAAEDWRARATPILTTEHFTLQGARSATIGDASGRANLYLGSVSLALVALALVAQASDMGTPFYVFALVLFPTLFFIGLATFARVNQSTVEDILLARGINRIRHFYLETVPQAEPYFILSANDDAPGVLRNMGIQPSRWQMFLTTAGMIGVLNSVVAAVAVGIAGNLLGWPLEAILVLAAVVFLVSVVIHYLVQRSTLEKSGGHHEVRFPSPD
jgi:hypothetical protein